jgi:hypothetical protein
MHWHPTVNVVELDLWRSTYEEKAGREWKLAGAERHRGSPQGELAGASESIEPARGMKTPLSNKPSEILRRGRESNPRIAVLQTATLPLGYPADLRKRTISL